MKFTEKAIKEGWDDSTEAIEEMMAQIIEDIDDDQYDTIEEVVHDCRWYITEFETGELETLKQALENRLAERAIEAEENEGFEYDEGPDAMDIAHELIEARYLGWIA